MKTWKRIIPDELKIRIETEEYIFEEWFVNE